MSDEADNSAHAEPDHPAQDATQASPARLVLDYARNYCQSEAAGLQGFVSWEVANRAGRAQIGQLQKLQVENRMLRHRLATLVDLLVARGVLDEADRFKVFPEPPIDLTVEPPPTEEQLLQYLEQVQDDPPPADAEPTAELDELSRAINERQPPRP